MCNLKIITIALLFTFLVGCTGGAMRPVVATHLMFEGTATDALSLYSSVFEDFKIIKIDKYGPNDALPEGTIKLVIASLAGQRFQFFDSPVKHEFTFTPAISIFVEFANAAELEQAFTKLSAAGQVLMPLDNYGFSQLFGWIQDRFGVSWQLNLK